MEHNQKLFQKSSCRPTFNVVTVIFKFLPAKQEDIGQKTETSPHPHTVELNEDGDEEEPDSGEEFGEVERVEGLAYLVHMSTAIS